MSVSPPPFGLLLDVDGPIASPITRTIAIESIVSDLVTLADAGIPIVFNTGRSDAFLRAEVVAPLVAAGLPAHARVFAVCEKGAVWFPITPAGAGEIEVSSELAVPAAYGAAIEELVATSFSEHMFFDQTKRAMVSVEQHKHVESSDYRGSQADFDAAAFAEMARHGLGVEHNGVTAAGSAGEIGYRVDSTIISTDVESIQLGKDLGAMRAIEMLRPNGPLPLQWRTVGDSRTDYAMADWLHEQGYSVAHVDVRPADGVPETPYPVLTAGDLIHDEAGAAFLARWVEMVRGTAAQDGDVR
ncbi:hypothetical protein [Microterricola viridarii]|uniref:Hydroxymethylpyrimidine pyrophosphatase n=1 Tax=Microterricola viridarii TaxID=412690 RepID=A0A109QXF5_9MICO|nr:hypothetical protein [Microterricola viridarii]AMB59899.1 hypothetical protein AWU67_14690 [Microterricola viridarii]